ncbi:hypothetical protein [Viridibacterium curvum]|uniref:Zinc-ribbon 15 domain-containing protein n=1 Tax=Viridibacterium curvum TaxID=1101404 RepID=A0ABP9QQL5_9RHOO
MLIFYGAYRVFPKLTAYRADWCNLCKKEVVSHQYRHFHIGHLYWIPLLPLGMYRKWVCSSCNRDPHTRVRTTAGIYVGGMFGFGLLLLLLVLADDIVADAATRYGLIAACCAGIGALVFGLRHALKEPPISNPVSPLNNSHCLICNTLLPAGDNPRCTGCGATRA